MALNLWEFTISSISIVIELITLFLVWSFIRSARKAEAKIWEFLGNGMFITMFIVTIGGIFQLLKFAVDHSVFYSSMILAANASYLIATFIFSATLYGTVNKIAEVFGWSM